MRIQTLFEEEEDFHSLKPGSVEWITFWKKHPEKQDEMLAFKKNTEKKHAPILRKRKEK